MDSNKKRASSNCSGEVPKCEAETNPETVSHIEKFSVQLINAESACPTAWCSGVLVELSDHYFIFTAGHCVPPGLHPASIYLKGRITSPSLEANIFEVAIKDPARIPGIHNDYALIEDYGVYELDVKGIEAVDNNGKCFLDINSLCVLEEKDFLGAWAKGILSGFPSATTDVIQQTVRSRFLAFDIYSDKVSYSQGNYRKCINVDIAQIVTSNPSVKFEGISGGGFWILKREESNNPWNLKLAGINVGDPRSIGTGSKGKMIMTLVGHHLRRIADMIDDLEELVFKNWSFLKNDPWKTVHLP
jgi:hypothetical protein